MAIKGWVQNFRNDTLIGWVFDDESEQPVTVDVVVNGMLLRRIQADGVRADVASEYGVLRCGFALCFKDDLLPLLPPDSRCEVVTRCGHVLPSVNGTGITPIPGRAAAGDTTLREKLAQGWVVDKWGTLKLPFRACPEKRGKLMQLYADMRHIFEAELGLQLFICYGTLLGHAREGRLLDHDDDVDTSFLLRADSTQAVAHEFHALLSRLIELRRQHGFDLSIVQTGQFTIWKDGEHLDVFLSWLKGADEFFMYFGVKGTASQDDLRLVSSELEGTPVLLPANQEKVLALTYGPDWRTPNPNFQWSVSTDVEAQCDQLRALGAPELAALQQRLLDDPL